MGETSKAVRYVVYRFILFGLNNEQKINVFRKKIICGMPFHSSWHTISMRLCNNISNSVYWGCKYCEPFAKWPKIWE